MASMKAPRKRREYMRAEREEILAAADEVGLSEAARRCGIPQTTVSNWRNRDARQTRSHPEVPPPNGDADARVEDGEGRDNAHRAELQASEKAQVLGHAAAHGVSAAATGARTT